jgi:hypothetical protein
MVQATTRPLHSAASGYVSQKRRGPVGLALAAADTSITARIVVVVLIEPPLDVDPAAVARGKPDP